MNTVKKCFKLLRIFCYRVGCGKGLNLPYHMKFIERKIRFSIEKGGKVIIGKHSWIRENVQFWCTSEAVIVLGENVFLNTGDIISSRKRVTIGDNTILGPNVMIYDHDHDYRNHLRGFVEGEVSIGKNVWIGANSCILKNVVIGDNCVIGAGTVVTKNIPDNSLVHGQKELIIRSMSEGK